MFFPLTITIVLQGVAQKLLSGKQTLNLDHSFELFYLIHCASNGSFSVLVEGQTCMWVNSLLFGATTRMTNTSLPQIVHVGC